jgi:glycoprotein-N-acetylgalactosamine 3-beta-galactosyltransferase
MLSLNNKKRSISIGIVLAGIILITIVYISSPTNTYYTNTIKFQLHSSENYSHIRSPRVLCLILTSPDNFLTRTRAVNATWGPRCDRYFFVTEYNRQSWTPEQLSFTEKIPIAPIKNITAGYDHLTQKSTLAFLFAYENYFYDFDWFVKADDDTYLIVDHLKTFLSEQDSSEPVTFGYNFKVIMIDRLLTLQFNRLCHFAYFS